MEKEGMEEEKEENDEEVPEEVLPTSDTPKEEAKKGMEKEGTEEEKEENDVKVPKEVPELGQETLALLAQADAALELLAEAAAAAAKEESTSEEEAEQEPEAKSAGEAGEDETLPATETQLVEAYRPAGVPDTLSAPLRAYLQECVPNLMAQEWSEHDFKTLVRKNPKISIGDATLWVVAETRGTALNLTVKYMLLGQGRGKNLGSSTFHPKVDGQGGYGVDAFLANKGFLRALEVMKAHNLADVEQWQFLLEQAKEVMDDVLPANPA